MIFNFQSTLIIGSSHRKQSASMKTEDFDSTLPDLDFYLISLKLIVVIVGAQKIKMKENYSYASICFHIFSVLK